MFIAIVQYTIASITWVFLKVFTNFKLEGLENLQSVQKPFVLVANHESHLDPQLTAVALLYKPSLFPMRYMAKDLFFFIPIFNLICWSVGAFRAHKKKGIGKSLLNPVRILEQKGAVIIFPEAHIVKDRPKLGDGRRGAAILGLTTRVPILPLSLHTPAHLNPFKFFFTRPTITIRVGEAFRLSNTDFPDMTDEHVAGATKLIMEKIGSLYSRHKY